jgi:hypothetical protein
MREEETTNKGAKNQGSGERITKLGWKRNKECTVWGII